MPILFSNTNTVWASVLVETLYRSGLTTAILCPGSRSAPLTVAFAQHPQIEAIPVLDERSAAFFALGIARQSKLPTVLVCTSGTAGANFFPAIIEARESRVPLLVLTADRPPEMRDSNAGQTIDQQKLYGTYPNWYSEIAVPSLELPMLAYLRQTTMHAWERSQSPVPGPVHLNLPFRDPLAPLPDANAQSFAAQFDEAAFFSQVCPIAQPEFPALPAAHPVAQSLVQTWQASQRGMIVAGPAQPQSPLRYCEAIARLSQTLGFPVLAEGLSPLRNYASRNPFLVSTYDFILRSKPLADKLAPEVVIRIGDMPTSKVLRQWLEVLQPPQWVIDPGDRNLDPTHGRTQHLRLAIEQLASFVETAPAAPNPYLQHWCDLEAQVRQQLDQRLDQIDSLIEGKVSWLLSQHLPEGTPLFIANSMPVRDVEWFWKPGDRRIAPFFNRGANGIDGTLSTALGIAHRQQSSVLLTGDLALLHDTNGFLLQNHWIGHLTIVLINNNGGGIFEMLPISQFNPPFETFFATPQSINLAKLCTAYEVEHHYITAWSQLQQMIGVLPKAGIRVLEIITDRKADAVWRKGVLGTLILEMGG